METRKLRPSVSMFIFIACGIWLIGLDMYFMVCGRRFSLKICVTWGPAWARFNLSCPGWNVGCAAFSL